MMEALNQPEDNLESNQEATQTIQKVENVDEILPNLHSEIDKKTIEADVEREESFDITNDVENNDEKEESFDITNDVENSDEKEESFDIKNDVENNDQANEIISEVNAETKENLAATGKEAIANVNEAQNTDQQNLSEISSKENHDNLQLQKAKINLVPYDDNVDEEELLKSDEDDEVDGREINKMQTSAVVLDNMTMEKEEELLKSDEDELEEDIDRENSSYEIDKDNSNAEVSPISETLHLEKAEQYKDKEVVTISDEDDTLNDKPDTSSTQRGQIENNLLNKEQEPQQESRQDEVINLDDDEDDNDEGNKENDAVEVRRSQQNDHNHHSIATKQTAVREEAPNEKILYKFDLDDDSSRESDYKDVPRDDLEEESHDTFASVNDDESRTAQMQERQEKEMLKNITELENSLDMSRKLNLIPDNNLNDNETAPFPANIESTEEEPKINGDYQKSELLLVSETELNPNKEDEEHEAVIDIDKTRANQIVNNKTVFSDDEEENDGEFYDGGQLKIAEDEAPSEIISKKEDISMQVDESTITGESYNGQLRDVPSESAQEDHRISEELDNCDNASRCSSIASSVSSSTTATSSSHQLVIDHPMEDFDVVAATVTTTATVANNAEEKVAPLKFTLKRKLSNDSEHEETMPTQPKQPLLDFDEEDEKVTDQKDEVQLKQSERVEEVFSPQMSEHYEAEHYKPQENDVNLNLEHHARETEDQGNVTAFKSLLLQQLQKPQMILSSAALTIPMFPSPPPPPPPPPIPTSTTSDRDTPLPMPIVEISPVKAETIPASTETSTGKTKYLCFKCRVGCFDTMAELNLHQIKCLSHNTSLLPLQQITQQQPLALIPANQPTANANDTTNATTPPLINRTILEPSFNVNNPTATATIVAQKRRYYKCSSCGTYHENWNLFLHIREKHNRHMCVYCIRFFPTAEKLSLHLEIKHDLEQNHFNSEDALRRSVMVIKEIEDDEQKHLTETRFLMCCTCEHIFQDHEPFSDHVCTEYMKPCILCGQKGRHTNQCKAHPDAKRTTSKVKKKVKERVTTKATTLAASASALKADNVAVQSSKMHADCVALPAHCDEKTTTTANIELQNEDSNHSSSSSNMVIDESCTTNHGSSLINPFKELDEREKLDAQQKPYCELNLPPDKTSSLVFAAPIAVEQQEKLIVPKLRLCVPKQYQKSVDAVISSTESEEEYEEEEDDEADDDNQSNRGLNDDDGVSEYQKLDPNSNTNAYEHKTGVRPHTDIMLDINSATESATEVTLSQEDATVDGIDIDDDSVDEPNSKLELILKEIERTKKDIQHTKKKFHHTPKHQPSTTPTQADSKTTSSQVAGTSERNWSPTTPPASPKTRCVELDSSNKLSATTENITTVSEYPTVATANNEENVGGAAEPLSDSMLTQSRRASAGSDAMDIDETITGGQYVETGLLGSQLDATTESSTCVDELKCDDLVNIRASTEHIVDNSTYVMKQAAESENCLNSELENSSENSTIKANESTSFSPQAQISLISSSPTPAPQLPVDGIEVANDDTIVVDLQLDRPLEKFNVVEFVRICLKTIYPLCLYCNHARRIAVNGKNLVLHMISQHRFSATVDSITAEELKPETIVAKLKNFLPTLEHEYFNSSSYCTIGDGSYSRYFNERIFECFQCRFVTSTHKELYLHNRKMHLRTAILCHMCRANFFSFSEILCHICPGAANHTPVFDVKFRCCLCEMQNIPSPFRLMVHLRKKHNACDVCLEDCRDQSRLSSHVWKHKLHHLCYRCGIAYRNKMDITKHLFWKHGTESIICKRCLQKRWRHVYHFCVPPATFVCEVCNLCFSKAMYLKVHKRVHTDDLRYPCSEENCEKKFISRNLLLKHTAEHQQAEVQAINEKGELATEQQKEDEKIVDDDEKLVSEEKGVKQEQQIEIKKELLEEDAEVTIKKEDDEFGSISKTELKSEGDEKSSVHHTATEERGNELSIKSSEIPRKKRKKSKRSKELLEDLNLTAPNLSESDSSDDSDTESRSKGDDESLVPKVMLSPPSEAENENEEEKETANCAGDRKDEQKDLSSVAPIDGDDGGVVEENDGTGKVLEIWKNLLQAQQVVSNKTDGEAEVDYTEDNCPIPSALHVAQSDHDYCTMIRPSTPPSTTPSTTIATTKSLGKCKAGKSPRHSSIRRSDASSSSSDDSTSSSDSSCSCGSNCSCSSSGVSSSSSSASSDDSDSSAASVASRKRHRKKSERDRIRKKSLSVSPVKKHNNSITETINIVDDEGDAAGILTAPQLSPPKEPLFYESDLETAESETDEEFYDEHPQKLASELLAQKRAQLMAQTRLSPSHNYDIVENSRPSTPSLPEDIAACETKVKLKKKKRDRKSTTKSANIGVAVPTLKLNLTGQAPLLTTMESAQQNQQTTDTTVNALVTNDDMHTAFNRATMQSTVSALAEPVLMQQSTIEATTAHRHTPTLMMTTAFGEQLTPRPIGLHSQHPGRMSEGSSCSDADASLKRSKRARRPNKFYGYTSDDENSASGLGQPLMIGMRAIKPQPPPQLTWRKEDLPTPSKSILNNKNKAPRTPKTPATPVVGGGFLGNHTYNTPLSNVAASPTHKRRKRPFNAANSEKSARNRSTKKAKSLTEHKMPRIPTLKIRSSQIGIATGTSTTSHIPSATPPPNPNKYTSSKESDDDDDSSLDDTSTDEEATQKQKHKISATTAANSWQTTTTSANLPNPSLLSQQMPPQTIPAAAPVTIPTPQATAFNHKIPPALLPNPDFATLQYFKANNIRYPIRPPAGARQPREGESVYCYCRCPYDEVSEMIACDGENCLIEWFHFECVGIMVAPQGKWFCAECRPQYSEELYPNTNANTTSIAATSGTTTTTSTPII